ncbi:hypothetical protein EPA93_15190 [Ktedonosporobacter rubrisoli]|uniref:Blue (type 1) copper domain-containing protein n=2 Tax=Ktedonosporobacter rubrisoli TaxID=2509675 RepID=A0A4P6JPS2_KTERU|nr:hypothetical protein [Ktedonosporobacter rubrisoli]QBD77264.1 hypothetical protein EPA93_15190 [Ktedonosporobacter rubrisoli]
MQESEAPAMNNMQISGNGSQITGPFTTAGTDHVYCSVHPGMKLTVIVQHESKKQREIACPLLFAIVVRIRRLFVGHL